MRSSQPPCPFPPSSRPSGLLIAVALASLLAALTGCEHRQAPTVAYSPGELEWGSHLTYFAESDVLQGDSLRVFYHIPETGNPAEFTLVVAMHGIGRNAEGMRNVWRSEADARGFIVIAPEFTEEQFPAREYALGRVLDDDGSPNPASLWTYQVVEDLFDEMVRRLDSSRTDYVLYGHSAGGQFAHRFHTLMPAHRARPVLAANAGFYLFPELDVLYPYGLALPEGETLIGPDQWAQRLAEPLVVLLGEQDNDPEHPQLPSSEGAMKQGAHRLERGLNYVQTASWMATEAGLPFDWTVVTVPGVAHSNSGMVPAAAQLVRR